MSPLCLTHWFYCLNQTPREDPDTLRSKARSQVNRSPKPEGIDHVAFFDELEVMIEFQLDVSDPTTVGLLTDRYVHIFPPKTESQ